MPELPEVETIRRDLAAEIVGTSVMALWTSGLPLRAGRSLDDTALAKATVGRRFLAPRRRAKYLLLDVEGGNVIVVHLGMSGRIVLDDASAARPRHTHVAWSLSDGRELRYVDPRRFGLVTCVPREREDGLPELAGLGLDPLAPEFTTARLLTLVHGAKRGLKAFLLDQSVLGGLGNIYVCEALFAARLSPSVQASRLRQERVAALREAIVAVLNRGIENRGTTLRDYVDVTGRGGENQLTLRVYVREGQRCSRRDGGVIRRVVMQGRSTFYCPVCQKRS